MQAFFVNESFPVLVKARFQREISMATWDGTDPIPDMAHALPNPATNATAPGGGILMVPAVPGVYQLFGIAYYPPEGISSDKAARYINISIRESVM